MEDDLLHKEREVQRLQSRVIELERLARLPGENPNPVARVSDEGIVLYRNPAAGSLTGWKCETNQPLPMPLRGLVLQALMKDQVLEKDVLLDGKYYSVSVILIRNQGYANIYGRDIGERKKSEAALAESERRQREMTRLLELDQARLAAVLRYLPVGVWMFDQQGRLTGNDQKADQIWAGEAPLLNSIDDHQKYACWYPDSGERLKPEQYPAALALRTGEPVEPMELEIRRFDGTEGTVLASAVPIKDPHGVVMGVVSVNVDITHRRQMEETLRRSEERIEKAFQATPDAIVISRCRMV